MTIKKAKVMAQRAMVESVIGLKIRSRSLWAKDASDDDYAIQSEVSASIQGIILDRPKYDKAKDIAMVTAKIRLGAIKNIYRQASSLRRCGDFKSGVCNVYSRIRSSTLGVESG